MEAQVGSCLCLRAKRVARRLGWQGVGFADGAAKTRQLDIARQPRASTAGSSGIFMIIRVIANVVGNYEGGQTIIWRRVDLAGGYAQNSWRIACCSCSALGQTYTTPYGCVSLRALLGELPGRMLWPLVPGCWTGSVNWRAVCDTHHTARREGEGQPNRLGVQLKPNKCMKHHMVDCALVWIHAGTCQR